MLRCTVSAQEALVRSETILEQLLGTLLAIDLTEWRPFPHPTYMGLQPDPTIVYSRDFAFRARHVDTEDDDPEEIELIGLLMRSEYSDIIPCINFEDGLDETEPYDGGVLGTSISTCYGWHLDTLTIRNSCVRRLAFSSERSLPMIPDGP